jgi:hypothetical protein
MTLCIGALCKDVVPTMPCIVFCFDSKVGGNEFASETEYKFHILSDQVMALVADRPGRGKELAGYYRHHLRGLRLTENNLIRELQEPVRTLKHRIAEAYTARKFGISYQDFLLKGAASFGHAAFDKHNSVIEANPLHVDMIIGGFFLPQLPGAYEPFLCELRDGELDRVTNFSLIGSGWYTAEPALHARAQTSNTRLPDAVYNVYEAKRLGESSPHVGKETRLYVLKCPDPVKQDPKLRVKMLKPEGEKELSKRFKKYGPRPVPVQKLTDEMFTQGHY